MSDKTFLDELLTDTVLSRRSFLKWSAALGGTMALAQGGTAFGLEQAGNSAEAAKALAPDVTIIPTGCAHNCGGRCQLIAWVQDGKIVRIETDPATDSEEAPALRACVRGRAYRRRVYSPDRLKYPMKRVGKRGEGKFERISWDEAATLAATKLKDVIDKYGNMGVHLVAGSGGGSGTMGTGTAARLLNLLGGYITTYNNYSWACTQKLTPYVYGTEVVGSTRNGWLQSKLILMWGWNPGEMIDGTNTMWYVKEARKRGAKTIVIDPRLSMSGVGLADEWIPIKPGTDAAMMSAMAYVIITENMVDQAFLDKYVVGFDEAHMPEGVPAGNSYKEYILGTVDKQPKTPEWAEAITGVPRETIIKLAREFGSVKPAMLYQGYGIQRRAYGESVVFAGISLAVITGNAGVLGGHASGMAAEPVGPVGGGFATGKNAVTAMVPRYKWHELMYRATEMTPADDGVVGLPKDMTKLPTNVKFLWEVAGQSILNQHGNINLVASKLADESLVEFIIVQDQFMTPSAKYADLLLPACTWMETDGIAKNWKHGSTTINMPKVIEPMYESKSDYQIAALIADKLGLKDKYTEGKNEADWVKAWIKEGQDKDPNFPSYEEFVKKGYYQRTYGKVVDPIKDFRADPEKNKLKTPSGKIEIFSKTLFDMNKPDTIPAVAKYIPEWEGVGDPLMEKYPLQGITHHYMQRVHSTHDQLDWYEEAWPQRAAINNLDAAARGIVDGDKIRIFNDRGQMIIPCRVTPRVMPGVIDIPQGAWWTPDEKGIDRRGAVNVLTSSRATPLAFGNPQGTFLVQVEKA
ncbi:MAG: molybdopterin-dependent oxidoreductase [Anaerolineae bacterium]|nr:molybdopterin-dependent oxidoreductase [Anaerolineae bacterium]